MAEFLRTLLTLTMLGSALTGLLMLVRPLIKSKTAFYYLWLLVLVRLCLPVGVTVPLPAQAAEEPAGTEIQQAVTQPAQPVEPVIVQPAQPEQVQPPAQDGAANVQPQPEPPVRSVVDWRGLFTSPALWFALWGLGAAFCLGRQVIGCRRFARLIRENGEPPEPEALALLARLDREGRFRLMVCPYVSTPMLLGVVRPTIVLPQGVEPDRLGDILAHELTHARRYDLLYKWFAGVVTSLHWFNPLMIVVRRQLSRACELSCDEAVVKRLDAAGRRHYGETLLAMAAGQPPRGMGMLAATLCEEKKHLKERLVSVMKHRRQGPAAVAITLVLAIGLTACAAVLDAQPTASSRPVSDPEALLDDPNLYQLSNGLTVALPADLTDDLLVQTPEEGNTFFSVYDKRSYEAGGGAEMDMGWIFSLARYDQTEFEESLVTDNSGRTFIAREDGWYYAWLFPTDVRFYSEAEDQTGDLAIWTKLNDRLPEEIFADFLSRNGLESFDESEIYHDGCFWDSEHVYVRYEGTESVTLLMSQPANQGEGGIWCVEGLFYNGYGSSVRVLPLNTGLPAAEYYAGIQKEADEGHRTDLLTPEGAAMDWLATRYDGVTADQVTLVEGEPAWNLAQRVLWPAMSEDGSVRLTYEEGGETRTDTYQGVIPMGQLGNWPWVKTQAPDSSGGSTLVYSRNGTTVIFAADGLVVVQLDTPAGTVEWYRWAWDPGTTPYAQLLQSCLEQLKDGADETAHTYSDQDVSEAYVAAENYFVEQFPGCQLMSVDYEPTRSYEVSYDYQPTDDQTELNNRIAISMSFFTGEGQGELEPDAYHFNVMLILRRTDEGSPWTVWDIDWSRAWNV